MQLEITHSELWLIKRALRTLGTSDTNTKLGIEAITLLERLIDDYR
jgi:hypothetical protein